MTDIIFTVTVAWRNKAAQGDRNEGGGEQRRNSQHKKQSTLHNDHKEENYERHTLSTPSVGARNLHGLVNDCIFEIRSFFRGKVGRLGLDV